MVRKKYNLVKKARNTFAALLYITVLLLPSTALASAITPENLLYDVNQVRAEYNVKKLRPNKKLTVAAEAKVESMARLDYFAHVDPNGKDGFDYIKEANYKYIFAGENLARGFATSEDIVAAWQKSPSHLANIINPNFEDSGITVAYDNEGRPLTVHFLGSRLSSLARALLTLNKLLAQF